MNGPTHSPAGQTSCLHAHRAMCCDGSIICQSPYSCADASSVCNSHTQEVWHSHKHILRQGIMQCGSSYTRRFCPVNSGTSAAGTRPTTDTPCSLCSRDLITNPLLIQGASPAVVIPRASIKLSRVCGRHIPPTTHEASTNSHRLPMHEPTTNQVLDIPAFDRIPSLPWPPTRDWRSPEQLLQRVRTSSRL